MRVKLLQPIIDPRTGKPKCVLKEGGKRVIVYIPDTIIEASDSTGQKWIDAGKAKKVA